MTPRLGLGLGTRHERTLESLYRRHAADVYRYALMMLGSAADAEDVTQTTFLNAHRALERGERPRAAGSWLRTIAHNLCLQQFRQAARRPHEVELDDDAPEAVTEDPAFLVDDLSRALRHIPVNQRAALLMRELEGRPIGEIATILGVSRSAVETLLFRARRGVREHMEGGLTCAEAEEAISRQLDGELKRAQRAGLRAHLRECEECAHLARSLRAQRGAIRSLAAIPLPVALAWSKFGTTAAANGIAGAGTGAGAATGGAWLAGSVASKVAGAAAVAALAAGAGYVATVTHPWSADRPVAKVPVSVTATGRHAGSAALPGTRKESVAASLTHGARDRAAPGHRGARSSSARRGGGGENGRQSQGATPLTASSTTPGLAAATGTLPGRRLGQVKHAASHPAHPTHPLHPTHPTVPAKPTHPPHPKVPSHPAKPTSAATTPASAPQHPTPLGNGKSNGHGNGKVIGG